MPNSPVPPVAGEPPLWQRRAVLVSFLILLLSIPFFVAGQSNASDYTGTGNWKVERGQQARFLIGLADDDVTRLASSGWLLIGRIALATMIVAALVFAMLFPRIRAWSRSRA